MMLVVGLIAILSAIAIPSFKLYIEHSKKSEAASNLKALFVGAATYYDLSFTNNAAVGATELTHCVAESANPGWTPGEQKQIIDWDAEDDFATYEALNFRPTEPLYFSYGVASDNAGCGNGPNDGNVYRFVAQGDLDGNGDMTFWSLATGTNENNTLYHAVAIKETGEGGCAIGYHQPGPGPVWLWASVVALAIRRKRRR